MIPAMHQASAKREPFALRQVRESVLAMLREGKAEDSLEYSLSALEAVLVKTHELELLVAKLRRARWNGKSERIDPAQKRDRQHSLGEVFSRQSLANRFRRLGYSRYGPIHIEALPAAAHMLR